MISVLLTLLLSTTAGANTFIGNGGTVIKTDGGWMLLDLAEAGLSRRSGECSKAPRDTFQLAVSPSLREHLKAKDWQCLTKAFRELKRASGMTSSLLSQIPALYQWSFVNGPLETLPESTSYIETSPGTLRTVANRFGHEIRIDKNIWATLSPLSRAALIFHELAYSAMRVQCDSVGVCTQDLLALRGLVGDVFRFSGSIVAADWLRAIGGDRLAEPLSASERLQAVANEFPVEGGEQTAVFFRRENFVKRGSSVPLAGAFTSQENVVRNLYHFFFQRMPREYEVFWWLQQASQFHYGCMTFIGAFAEQVQFRSDSPDLQSVILSEMTSELPLAERLAPPVTLAAIYAHQKAVCDVLGSQLF